MSERRSEVIGINDCYEYNEILLDSHDYESGSSDNPTFNVQPAFRDAIGFKVISARVPFSYYVFNSYNNTFELEIYYDEVYYYQTITVPVGNYTVSEFASWFDTYLTELDFSTLKMKIDSTNSLFEFSENGSAILNVNLTEGLYTLTELLTHLTSRMTEESINGWIYEYATNGTVVQINTDTGTNMDTNDLFIIGQQGIWEIIGFPTLKNSNLRTSPTGQLYINHDENVDLMFYSNVFYPTFNVSYSDITCKLTVKNLSVTTIAGDYFNFIFTSGETTPQYWIGATSTNISNIATTTTTNFTMEFPYTVQISGPNYLLLNSNLGQKISRNVRVNGTSTFHPPAICKIPVDVNKWEIIEYNDPNPDYFFDFGDDICQQLRFWFTWGDLENPANIDFNKQGFSLTLGLLTQKTTKNINSIDLNNTSKRIRVY
jgi:hypothetical protein